MSMPALVPHYTADELRHFPDDRLRYEVIRGELFVTPTPGTAHQRAVLDLATALKAFVEHHRLGEVLTAPYEVQFADDTAVQPDVLVIPTERARHLTRDRFRGPPTLVVEVVSYSSKRTDRLQKRDLYMATGVDEYWVVDPGERRIERWRPGTAAPDVLADWITWQASPDAPSLELDLVELFRRAWR
jgi:Uma2 family endonuclease